MDSVTETILDEEVPQARLGLLLKHFSQLDDAREPWRVVYPLGEVLLLVTCATIASCDDFDDIIAWGKHRLGFLRRFSEFHHGIPCERWLRCLANRVDPALFGRCFENWVAALWPDRHAFIAIDGKTSRRTHDRRKGIKALHTLSAYATNARLVLAQLSVPEKTNEITAIPDILDQLAEAGQLEGALVTVDAIGCQVGIADKIVEHKADYLLPLKGNQATLETDVEDYFRTAPPPKPSPKPPSRKDMAASRRAPIRLPASSIGFSAAEATRASRVSPTSRPSSRSLPAPNTPIGAPSIPTTISVRRLTTSSVLPGARAATWASRACIGCSMSSSRTTCRVIEPDMAPRIWPSSAASPSASCAPKNQTEASKHDEKSPAGTRTSRQILQLK
jgi:predicted transposase YbfD/YdcC